MAEMLTREGGLKRGLSSGQLSMIAIGGAVGTGLFLGSGFAISFAGPSVLVSYGIGAAIAFLLMGCLAEMTVAHPTTGSFGVYADYYIGPWAGFVVRYCYWFGVVFAVGTEVTAVAIYMHYWYPAVPGWLWIIVFSFGLILVNAFHVEVFGRVEYMFSALKISAILLFIALAVFLVSTARPPSDIGWTNYTAHGGFFPRGVWGMWVAVIVSIFSYLSIEMIAVAAGEARDPKTAVTRAFRATVFRLIFFYLVTIALMLALVPWDQATRDQSPFVKVMTATHIPGAAGVINFVVLIAALSAMNSQLYITSRMMFSLARAGYAPQRFGELSRRGVPTAALLLSSIGIALATVLNIAYPASAFTLMMSIAMFGAMFTWLTIFVTHLFFRRRHNAQRLDFRLAGYPYTTWSGVILMFAILLTTAFTQEFRMTLGWGIPLLAGLSASYAVWHRRQTLRLRSESGPATHLAQRISHTQPDNLHDQPFAGSDAEANG